MGIIHEHQGRGVCLSAHHRRSGSEEVSMSTRRFKPASWVLLALAIAVPGAKADEVTPVTVSQTPSSIVVRGSRPTSLRTVLKALCKRTPAQSHRIAAASGP